MPGALANGMRVIVTDGVSTVSSDVVGMTTAVFSGILFMMWSNWFVYDVRPRMMHAIVISAGMSTSDANAMFPPADHNDWAWNWLGYSILTIVVIVVHVFANIIGHGIALAYAKCVHRCSHRIETSVAATEKAVKDDADPSRINVTRPQLGVRQRQFGAVGTVTNV